MNAAGKNKARKPVVRMEARPAPPLPASAREYKELAAAVAGALGLERAGFELLLTDDARIARLNRTFLGLPGPTNVLSFPDEAGPGLGQVALSVDAVEREALLYGQDPVEHLVRLLAHGLLHLSGLDHGGEMYDLTEAAVGAVAEKFGSPARTPLQST